MIFIRKGNDMEEKKVLNIYEKINKVRLGWVNLKVKPTGKNAYTKVNYFEEGDLIPNGVKLSEEFRLCPLFDLTDKEISKMVIYDVDSEKTHTFTLDRAEAGLKGVTPIQNLGAEITYLKRYLWRIYLEAVEGDALDGNNGSGNLETNDEFSQLDHINFLIQDTKFTIDTVYDWIEKKYKKRTPIDELTKSQFSELKNSLLSAVKKDKQTIESKEDSPYNYQK
jgi:hypothetical protein